MFVYGFMHMSAIPVESEKGTGFPGVEVTGSCELYNMGLGNQTSFLCKRL